MFYCQGKNPLEQVMPLKTAKDYADYTMMLDVLFPRITLVKVIFEYINKYISGKEHLQMHVKGATGFFWISKVSPETFEILARF